MAGCSCCGFDCCPGGGNLPATLHIALSGNTGSLGNPTLTLTYQGACQWVVGTNDPDDPPGTDTISFLFEPGGIGGTFTPAACTAVLLISDQTDFPDQITIGGCSGCPGCGSASGDWHSASCSPCSYTSVALSSSTIETISTGTIFTVTI